MRKQKKTIASKSKTAPTSWATMAILLLIPIIAMQVLGLLKGNNQSSKTVASSSVDSPTPIIDQTEVVATQAPMEAESSDSQLTDLFSQMDEGGDSTGTAYVSGGDTTIQAIKQGDDTWVVTKIYKGWPEAFADFGVKTMTYDFIREIYASKFSIKQAGMTINGSGGKFYRAFLGSNQASADSEWKSYGPSNFYNWIKGIETSREEDRANATFIEENL